MMIITEEQSVIIINLRKMIKETWRVWEVSVIFERLGWLILIVICFVLMLCDRYAIVRKGRVYVVEKMNVECWGLF